MRFDCSWIHSHCLDELQVCCRARCFMATQLLVRSENKLHLFTNLTIYRLCYGQNSNKSTTQKRSINCYVIMEKQPRSGYSYNTPSHLPAQVRRDDVVWPLLTNLRRPNDLRKEECRTFRSTAQYNDITSFIMWREEVELCYNKNGVRTQKPGEGEGGTKFYKFI